MTNFTTKLVQHANLKEISKVSAPPDQFTICQPSGNQQSFMTNLTTKVSSSYAKLEENNRFFMTNFTTEVTSSHAILGKLTEFATNLTTSRSETTIQDDRRSKTGQKDTKHHHINKASLTLAPAILHEHYYYHYSSRSVYHEHYHYDYSTRLPTRSSPGTRPCAPPPSAWARSP